MTKILFDHQNFSLQKFGGITRYFAGLIESIKHHPDYSYQLGVLISNNQYIKNEKLLFENSLIRPFFNAKPSRIYKWNKMYSKYLIRKDNFDVFHPTYYHPYFLKLIRKPYLLTIHDMTYEVLPEYFEPGDRVPYNKKITCEGAAALIAISESTRNDLINILNIPPEKIKVIYHGINLNHELIAEPIAGLPENYILFVGLRSSYKNFFRFIKAAAELIHKFNDLHVVCVGGGSFCVADLLAIQRLKIADNCIQMDVSDTQLNYLYQKASLFVFPSLYEGFGYPLLEAFKAGCPIAASNTSCIPEIGGDAIAYFNPYETGSIYDAMNSVLNDTNARTNYMQKGFERLQLFPIEKQAEKTLKLYNEIAKG
jgi:glycosyltransferase involved in cell wall biosynthesis